ncbi:signal peptidase I [Flavobacterium zepuense]|uniref:Signal peptidase I n=1 Tax=Flavobacterium zepuense TaxID=2593302 RepID=A0A552V2N0_9FLAO|nr:signal peptidase I [Flavobacterium zepuense]TRW24717.1 signal peptidase I [Flavobacterium zepuense]
MTLLQWFIFFLAVQVVHFAGTWKLYQKAGKKPWQAAVPVYNAIVLMQIINRPRWWAILLFVPIVNLIMFPVVWVETLRSFGKTSTTDTLLGIFTLGFYIYYINYTQEVEYRPQRSLMAATKAGDTVSSLLFAIVVATIVHTYVMQPFQIPTASLEKTLLVGDFLFVSKFNYGARVPMTTVAAPMVHDSLPLVKTRSYFNWPQLPYLRLPGFENVKKNDIVVFNWPVDTLVDYTKPAKGVVVKPIDKKTNYVKRCVGTPGDNLEIKDGLVFINGKELTLSDRARVQYHFNIETNGDLRQDDFIGKYKIKEFTAVYAMGKELWDNKEIQKYLVGRSSLKEIKRDSTKVEITGYIGEDDAIKLRLELLYNKLSANLTYERADLIKKDPFVKSISQAVYIATGAKDIFPQNNPAWSVDKMGPITIPQEGKTVQLNRETLPFYKLIIADYEHNDLKVTGDEIRINGQVATSYTFKQNYYWMMGDNRHNSLDSRYFGFVPEDHIVGKPVFIWMSYDSETGSVRWDRLFTTVGGDGEPVSYFNYFIIGLVAWFGFDYFRKRKKAKE